MNMEICSSCVLDETIEGISFDEKGMCNYCRDFKAAAVKEKPLEERTVALKRLIEKIKAEGEGKEYDCLIGLSGGVDSSYVAYLTKQYGLRPLAVHLDNGWNAELAVHNIEAICKSLDIDLFTYVINWHEFKDLQLSFLKASVANAEAPTDHAIFASLYQLAIKHNIKYILDGVNTNTEYTRKDFFQAGYYYADLRQLKGIHKKYGSLELKTFPRMSIIRKFWYKKIRRIRQVSILDLIDYQKEHAMQLLTEEVNWKPYDGKHHESLFTKWHQLVYLPKKFKFDKRKMHLSDLVLSGQITRNDALAEVKRKPVNDFDLRQLEEYVMKKLDLREEEYNAILIAAPKSFLEYPNSKWMLDIYARMRK